MCVCLGRGSHRLQHCEQHWRPDQWRHTGTRARIPSSGNQTSSLTYGLKHVPFHRLETKHNTAHLIYWKPESSLKSGLELQWKLASGVEHILFDLDQMSFIFLKPNKSTTIRCGTGPVSSTGSLITDMFHFILWKLNKTYHVWSTESFPTSGLEHLPVPSTGNQTSSFIFGPEHIPIHLLKTEQAPSDLV